MVSLCDIVMRDESFRILWPTEWGKDFSAARVPVHDVRVRGEKKAPQAHIRLRQVPSAAFQCMHPDPEIGELGQRFICIVDVPDYNYFDIEMLRNGRVKIANNVGDRARSKAVQDVNKLLSRAHFDGHLRSPV